MPTVRMLAVSLLIAAVPLAGCNQKFSDDSNVLATVNGDNITEKDYENYLQLRANRKGQIPDKDKEKKIVLDEMISRTLLTQQGVALGYEKNPEIYFHLKRVREEILAQEVLRSIAKDTKISDDDVKKRLTDEFEKIHKTEYKVRQIVLKTEDDAKAVAQQLKAGKKFDQAAKEKSIDGITAKRGGLMEDDWINQGSGSVPSEVFDVIMAQKKGQASDPIKTDYGWYIVRIDDTRPLKIPPLEEFMKNPQTAAGLRQRMQEEKFQTTLKEMRDKAKVVIK